MKPCSAAYVRKEQIIIISATLWQTCCLAYLQLIRQAYQVSAVVEDEFKSTTPEEFEIITGRINEWCSDPASSQPALSALQEVIELKKLNGGLMKAGAIDDVINDCYTTLYFKTGKSLPGPDVATLLEEKEQERLQNEARQLDKDNADPKPLNPFSGILNAQSHENSGTEGGPGDSTPANMDGVQRPRKSGIRRADVLRRAEQAVLRAQEGPRPTNGKSVALFQVVKRPLSTKTTRARARARVRLTLIVTEKVREVMQRVMLR